MESWAPLAPVSLVASIAPFAIAAYAVTRRYLDAGALAVRLCGAFVLAMWALVVTFFVLSPLRQFTSAAALLVGLVVAGVTLAPASRRASLAAGARSDFRAVAVGWRAMSLPARALVGAGVAIVGLLVIPRTLVLPPLGFDDMTYHLFKSGSWVGAGGFTTQAAPDAWTYYDYFPASGEVIWAWFLLPARSGTYLGIAALTAWLGALGGGYAAARLLGCSRDASATAAAAIVSVAAAAHFVGTSNVDNLHLAGFLIGFAFLLVCRQRFAWWPAAAALVAFAFAAGVKTSGLAALALACGWLALMAVRAGDGAAGARPARAAVRLLGLLALASLVAAPWYVRAMIQQGSPLYPVAAPVIGDRLPTNGQLAALLNGHFFGESPSGTSLSRALDGIVLLEAVTRQDETSWPPAPFLWAFGALAGVFVSFRRRSNLGPTCFLLLCIGAALSEVLSPAAFGLRNYFPTELARLLLPMFAAMVLLTMQLPWRAWLWAPQVLVAAQWVFTARTLVASWDRTAVQAIGDWAANGWVALLVAILALVTVVALRSSTSRAPRLAATAVGVVAALAFFGAPLEQARIDNRHAAFAAHPRPSVCLSPMWEAVDGPESRVVAVAAGIGGVGHNNHRFPYLGSRLSNRVVYLPITADGSIVDYHDPSAASRLDEEAWLARVREAGADFVALIAPLPPEASVASRHPELFEEVARATCDDSVLYRVRPVGR